MEWVNLLVEERCDANKSKRSENEDFAVHEKKIKEISAKYVYTHPMTGEEPLTENVRKSMTRNVRTSAFANLLGQVEKDEDNDRKVINFARDDLSKNVSTKKPARLQDVFACYNKAIGEISCGNVWGTCWLVIETVVITNLHVYTMINEERKRQQNPNLPILVTFDYFSQEHAEKKLTVQVDEENDPKIESSPLDFKFLRLNKNNRLDFRIRLGEIVRCRPVHEGLVFIIGYCADGSEMHEETCVVVRSNCWRKQLKERLEHADVHMANENLLNQTEKYNDCAAYDTTMFSGASGSPVFDMNGNIVALHTQGYTLEREDGDHSLMEFGVKFSAICNDTKRRKLDVKKYFPNYEDGKIICSEEQMEEEEQGDNEEPMEEEE